MIKRGGQLAAPSIYSIFKIFHCMPTPGVIDSF
jgi:hypothetical protein